MSVRVAEVKRVLSLQCVLVRAAQTANVDSETASHSSTNTLDCRAIESRASNVDIFSRQRAAE
jgi:hypothetical protein